MNTDFTKMTVWQKAMDIAIEVQKLTKSFPKDEMYGITSQMRRSSVSVAANIAEGFGRYTYKDKKHKYVIARGELIELMTFLYYSERVGYIRIDTRNTFLHTCTEVHKMLNSLIAKMNHSLIPKS